MIFNLTTIMQSGVFSDVPWTRRGKFQAQRRVCLFKPKETMFNAPSAPAFALDSGYSHDKTNDFQSEWKLTPNS